MESLPIVKEKFASLQSFLFHTIILQCFSFFW